VFPLFDAAFGLACRKFFFADLSRDQEGKG
jgi:hypothetical protein